MIKFPLFGLGLIETPFASKSVVETHDSIVIVSLVELNPVALVTVRFTV